MIRARRDGLPLGSSGAAAVEFSLTAGLFVLLLMGTIQTGLTLWQWQVLETVAIDTARCSGINAPPCENATTDATKTQSYASQLAASLGVSDVSPGDVSVSTSAAACGGLSQVISVAITYPLNWPISGLLPDALTVSACSPLGSG